MAGCKSCGTQVSCGCSLIDGLCTSCYNKTLDHSGGLTVQRRATHRIVYSQPESNTPGSEFEIILKTQGLTKEQKIKRINDILEKAREQVI